MRCQVQHRAGVILHSGAIGDCLLTLPLASYVKSVHRLDRIDFIGPTEYIGFYPGRTCIDAVHSIETIELHRLFGEAFSFAPSGNDRLLEVFGRYEQIISFIGFDHPSFEHNLLFAVHSTHSAEVTLIPPKPHPQTAMHVSDYYLDFFKQQQFLDKTAEFSPTLIFPQPDDYHAGSGLLEDSGVDSRQNVVVIHPGSGSFEKCWHWQNFSELASNLAANGMRPVFLLGPAEQERFSQSALQSIRRFPTLESLSLTQVLQVLTQADIFLGNDSGIGHLAAGMGRKTLVLFGFDTVAQYAPRGNKVQILCLSRDGFQNPDVHEQARVAQKLFEML